MTTNELVGFPSVHGPWMFVFSTQKQNHILISRFPIISQTLFRNLVTKNGFALAGSEHYHWSFVIESKQPAVNAN